MTIDDGEIRVWRVANGRGLDAEQAAVVPGKLTARLNAPEGESLCARGASR